MPFSLRAATNELSSALQTGLFEEEANRNLPAAVDAYEKVAKQFDQNRALAATAIFRLGEVNRKLGKTNEAAAFYQRILREFTDQDTLAKLSQQNLAGMGMVPDKKATTAPAPVSPAELSPEAQELVRTERIIAQLRGWDLSQLRKLIPTLVPDAEFERLNEQLSASEKFGDFPSPDILKRRSELMDKLGMRSQIIMRQLEVRAQELVKTVADQEKTKLAVDRALPKTSAITAVLDEEETEIRRIQAMIQNSPDLINAPSGENGTPLYQAASKGQLRVATFLLDHGADVDTRAGAPRKTYSDWTPLYAAANQGHKAMVELLAARGAEVNATVERNFGSRFGGKSALHRAVEKGFQAVAEALLANKADINARDKLGWTPLHYAASGGHPALTAFLLSKGAEVNTADSSGGTPLMYAARDGHADTLKQLIVAKADANAETTGGSTALGYAAGNGHQDCVTALLAAKANPNAGKVDLPLHCAIKSQSVAITEALLKAGADANRICKVTWAVRVSNTESAPGRELTPLALAMSEPQLDVVKLLLDNKADPNGKRLDGLPLIFSAVNNPEMTKVFLDAGAKPNVDDGTGHPRTPLLNAGNSHIVMLLLAAGANTETRHRSICDNSDLGMTPLLIWTSCWNLPDLAGMVEALLKGGANVNARTVDGWTPLHFTAASKKKELMELLLAYKADANARNNQGFTPLDLALGKHLASGQVGVQGSVPVPPPRPGGRPVAPKADDSAAELLRQHGGLADLPKLDRIELARAGSFQKTIFIKGTNDWNRFTLLDVILNNYRKGSGLSPQASAGATFTDKLRVLIESADPNPITYPPFPDLRRIVVIRQQPVSSSKPAERIVVDLLNATNGVDCANDIALNFGDVVEIPERLHTLQEPAVGLTSAEMAQIIDCRKGMVTLVYQGKKTSLPVGGSPAEALIGSILAGEEARKALFSSADLTRVKVTRRESANAKPRVWVVDCSNQEKAPELWLRDGDVIEVPEK